MMRPKDKAAVGVSFLIFFSMLAPCGPVLAGEMSDGGAPADIGAKAALAAGLPAALPLLGTNLSNLSPAALPDLSQDIPAASGAAGETPAASRESEIGAPAPTAAARTAPSIEADFGKAPEPSALLVKSAAEEQTSFPAQPRASMRLADSNRSLSARRQLTRMAAANLRADLFDGVLAAHASAGAPEPSERGISPEWIDRMRRKDAVETSSEEKRLRDASQRLGFSQVALNREVIDAHTNHYTVELPAGAITNQKNSGRCWIFAGLNMIRSTLFAEKRLPRNFLFSQNYIYFFSLLEQANLRIGSAMQAVAEGVKEGAKISTEELRRQLSLADKVEDGGWFEYFQFLATKYGLVPESAMPETKSSQNSAVLLQELSLSLAQSINEALASARRDPAGFDAKKILEARALALDRIWKVLATHLGTPPERFEFREEGKPEKEGPARKTPAKVADYTPLEFARNFVRFNPDDYVVLANSPSKKNNQVYTVKDSAIGAPRPGRPAPNARFLNVSLTRMERLVAASISAGHPVWIAADVDHDMDADTGIMHPKIYQKGALYGFTKAEKPKELTRTQATYLMVRSPDHAMAITGYDRPESRGPIVKFKVENSWGSRFGSRGIFHMYREWFRENLYEIVVHKRLLSPAEKKALKAPAKEIGEGDMF